MNAPTDSSLNSARIRGTGAKINADPRQEPSHARRAARPPQIASARPVLDAMVTIVAVGFACSCVPTSATEVSPTSVDAGASAAPAEGEINTSDFSVFPADNPWNTDISGYPVHPNSDNFLASMGLDTGLHPDFGTE